MAEGDLPSSLYQETVVLKGLGSQRLVALFTGAGLLFNFPLLGLWDRDVVLWGIPLFPLALFTLWASIIAALAWLMERPQDRFDERQDPLLNGRVSTPPTPEDKG